MSHDSFSPENVLVISFGDDPGNDHQAYGALTDLSQLDAQGQIAIKGATVVTRLDDGRVVVKSEVGHAPFTGTATGGLVGLLIGIIGGPLGMLLGGTTGVLFGSVVDLDDAQGTESVLEAISGQVQPGRTALLAHVVEPSPEVIDAAMAEHGGAVLRRSASEVEGEIAAAQDAQRRARREARAELRRARVDRARGDAHAKVEEMTAGLRRPRTGAPA